MHGIQVVIARNYIENLREEVRKGMREKAEQGIYPSRPPLGYRNNKLEYRIEVDAERAPIAQSMFALYASGQHSLNSVRKVLKTEFGIGIAKGYLERLLKNPFYKGQFIWEETSSTAARRRLLSAPNCLSRCRPYSGATTNPSTGSMILPFRDYSAAPTTIAW